MTVWLMHDDKGFNGGYPMETGGVYPSSPVDFSIYSLEGFKSLKAGGKIYE